MIERATPGPHETRCARLGRQPQEVIISKFDNGQIHVFTQPGCGPCTAVIRHLQKHLGDDLFEEQVQINDVQEDPEAADFVRSLNLSGTPVTYFRGAHAYKYRPDLLEEYTTTVRQEASAA